MLAEQAPAADRVISRQNCSVELGNWPSLLAFVAFIVLLWSALPALLQTVPHADNVEQLNWAHALQWGYFKHPPLPTWLLHAAIEVFGASAFLTYALAMSCVGATLLILWRCALLLLNRADALVAVLLSSADYYLMGRGSFLNHNTVMLPFVAASAWCVLHIVRDEQRKGGWLPWAMLGISQSLGLLSKYQMAIFIGANALALIALGVWRRPRFWRYAALCGLLTLIPLAPHLQWLASHEFSTFTYASHSLLAELPLRERLLHLAGFVVQQIGRLAPALFALGLAIIVERSARGRSQGQEAPREPDRTSALPQRRALAILAVTPFALVLALVLFAGVAPQNHWGATATLLLPLYGVSLLRESRRPGPRSALVAVITAHTAALIWNVVVATRAPGFHHSFAAQPLAAMALAHWQANTSGRLEVVIGPDWEAGAIALELPSHPAVLSSGERNQAPWVTAEQLARCGALVLWRPGQAPEQQVGKEFAARMQSALELQTRVPRGALSAIGAGIIAPTSGGC